MEIVLYWCLSADSLIISDGNSSSICFTEEEVWGLRIYNEGSKGTGMSDLSVVFEQHSYPQKDSKYQGY